MEKLLCVLEWSFSTKTWEKQTLYKYKNVIFGLFGLLVIVICGLLLHGRGRILLKKMWFNIRVHSIKAIEKLKNAIRIYWGNPLVIIEVFGLTVFLQILVITCFWFLGTNLGITADIRYYYVFFTYSLFRGCVAGWISRDPPGSRSSTSSCRGPWSGIRLPILRHTFRRSSSLRQLE